MLVEPKTQGKPIRRIFDNLNIPGIAGGEWPSGKFESDRYNAYYPYALIYGFGNRIFFFQAYQDNKKGLYG